MTAKRELFVWGNNARGQLGLGNTTTPVTVLTQLGSQSEWAQASAGNDFSIGIKTDGTMWGWGNDTNGNTGLGITTNTNTVTPTQIGTATNWVQASAGVAAALAINSSGELYAWGSNGSAITGLGTAAGGNTTPVRVGTASNWAFVSVSNASTYALTTTGELWSWGSNTDGATGLGLTTGETLTPTRVGTASNWVKVKGANFGAVAINTAGELWVWGQNTFHQLGLNDTTNRTTPTRSGTASNWVDVSSRFAGFAVNTLGELYAWGFNGNGATGLGLTTGSTTLPTRVGTESNWVKVFAMSSNAFAINSQGDLYGWGFNAGGQLGLGNTTSPVTTPTLINAGTQRKIWFKNSDTGFNHSLAFKEVIAVEAEAALTASFTTSLAFKEVIAAEAALTASFTTSQSAVLTKNIQSQVASTSSTVAAVNVVKGLAAAFQSTTNIEIIIFADGRYYIDPGYIDDGYYVAEYEGSATLLVNSNAVVISGKIKQGSITLLVDSLVTAKAGKLLEGSVVLTSEFIQTATISHIHGADLFALSDALLALAADRVRDNNVEVTSVFDIAVDYLRFVSALSEASAEFNLFSDIERSRDFIIETQAAFSLAIEVTKIIGFDAVFNNQATLTAEVERDQTANAQLTVDSQLTATAMRIQELNSLLSSDSQITANAAAVVNSNILVTVNSNLTTDAAVIRDFNSNLTTDSALFVDYSVINSIVFVFAESVTQLVANASKDVNTVSDLASEFNQVAVDSRIRDNEIITESVAISLAAAVTVRRGDVFMDAVSTMAVSARVITELRQELISRSTVTFTATKLINSSANLVANGGILIVAREIRVDTVIYTIPSESRIRIIGSESRIYTIRSL